MTLPGPTLQRRHLLAAAFAAAATPRWAAAADTPVVERIATAWQLAGTSADHGFQVGVFDVDWLAARITLACALPVPSRAHGLLALPDGGFVAVANRPGRWLMRVDRQGQVAVLLRLATNARSLNGHAEADARGQWIYTTETDPADGQGWVSVRDARTLACVAQWRSGGIDPHQLLRAPDGSLMLAQGGIWRDGAGRKVDIERMAPSLVRLAANDGSLQGRWALADPRLSIRHLAWSAGAAPVLGLALQAEHDDALQRAAAPALALLDGHHIMTPCADTAAAGYTGDIAAGPAGGFVLSAQKQGRALWWQPAQPTRLTAIAELTEPCALLPTPTAAGVLLGAGRGLARWQVAGPPAMLRWPVAMAPDNHAVRLA